MQWLSIAVTAHHSLHIMKWESFPSGSGTHAMALGTLIPSAASTASLQKPHLLQAHISQCCSEKSALRSATKHLALELGAYNIRVNSCHMGWMWGPNVEGYFAWQAQATGRPQEELIAEVAKNIPLGAIPDDGECAKAAMFLASDYASVVTGAALDVNGGEFMPI